MFQDFSHEHDHNTRQSLVLNNMFSSSRYGENCIRFYLPLLVNNSSQCVLEKVTTHRYQGFMLYIKKRMIDRYVAQCYVRLCYDCNRNWWNASDAWLFVIVPVYTLVNMLFSHWVSLYVCVIFHLMCSIFCRHHNCFVQYLWSMWALKTLSRHRWTAIGINFPVMRACYIVQSTTWSITGLYHAPVAVTRAIIFKKK